MERYILETFGLLATAYNAATDQWEEQNALPISKQSACFHIGLFTRDYKPFYAIFEPNRRIDSNLAWHLRKRTMIEPAMVVSQFLRGRVQYLLPISFSDTDKVELAIVLSIMEGYYQGETCLLPQMAYMNARLIGKPTAL